MSTAARKARKRARIKFVKPAKVKNSVVPSLRPKVKRDWFSLGLR